MAKPPGICAACSRDFSERLFATGQGGAEVTFADFVDLPRSTHSPGREWFCAEHLNAANAHSHEAFLNALQAIRREAGLPPHGREYSRSPAPSLWVLRVGPTPLAVASVLRSICGCSPAHALKMVSTTIFAVEPAERPGVFSPQTLRDWATLLEQAGAATTVRYNDGLD